jgi:hypothetical protein
MGASESLRRNADNNAFEAFTPAAGISLLDVYPIGSIYLSIVDTDPSTLFGGTWESIAEGMVLVGLDSTDAMFDTAEETGGAKTVQSSAQTFAGQVNQVTSQASAGATSRGSTASTLTLAAHTHTLTPAGTNTPGAATSVVQPYFVCYIWKRSA